MKSLTTWLAVLCFSFVLTGCKDEAEVPADDSGHDAADHDAGDHDHDADGNHDADGGDADSGHTNGAESDGATGDADTGDDGPALPSPNEGGLEDESGSLD